MTPPPDPDPENPDLTLLSVIAIACIIMAAFIGASAFGYAAGVGDTRSQCTALSPTGY